MEDSADRLSSEADAAAGKALTAAGNVLTGERGGVGNFQGAGPLSTILADGMAQAQADAAARSVAEAGAAQRGPVTPPAGPAFTGASSQALTGTDSRSKEGVSEMFRLMRGSGEEVQEQQLGVLRQIRDAVSEGDEMESYDILGA
jgi:hypothetical protein